MASPMIQAEKASGWMVCPECEATIRERELPPRTALRCGRCGVLARKQGGGDSLQPAFALATAGLILVVLTNVEPILTFEVAGNSQSALVITGVIELFNQGYWPVAIVVFFASICGPALHLAAVWYVTAAICWRQRWPGLPRAAKFVEALESWNLTPVYAVATLVAVVRLDLLGQVEWRLGTFWMVALSLCSLLVMSFFDHGFVEQQLEQLP